MSVLDNVLKAFSGSEEAKSPSELAKQLNTTEDGIRSTLSKLKKKGLVRGAAQEWYLADAGKELLDKEEEVTITPEDVGTDELSQFKYFGQLASVPENIIAASSELFQNLDMRKMDEMRRVMAEMNVPQIQRMRWENNYRGYLRNTTPPETRDELYPLPTAKEVIAKIQEVEEVGDEEAIKKGLDFVIDGNDIHRVGPGIGEFTFRQALQVLAAKRGTVPQPQPQSQGAGIKELADVIATLNPTQPLSIQDVLTIVNTINEQRGGGDGQPQQQKGFVINPEGDVTELKEGQPIVIKKVERQPAKTYFLNENQELVEQDPGKPIVIKVQQGSPNSGMPAMLPFPVMGSDGQPVLDREGKPVYANLEPMMKYLGFLGDQRRADERHNALMGLAKTVRENVSDGVSAIKTAAAEVKRTSKAPATEEAQVFECGNCHTQFRVPQGGFEKIACPSCQYEYTKEALEST